MITFTLFLLMSISLTSQVDQQQYPTMSDISLLSDGFKMLIHAVHNIAKKFTRGPGWSKQSCGDLQKLYIMGIPCFRDCLLCLALLSRLAPLDSHDQLPTYVPGQKNYRMHPKLAAQCCKSEQRIFLIMIRLHKLLF